MNSFSVSKRNLVAAARVSVLLGGLAAIAVGVGCSPKRKQVSERDRKEAALLVSEAQFAMTMRDWSRAEGSLAKAVQLSPEGDFWIALGSTRVRLGNRAAAKEAYQEAVKAYEADAANDATRVEPWLNQVRTLALLGRNDDARAVLAKAAKKFPNDGRVKALLEPKQFEQMITAPVFKEIAL